MTFLARLFVTLPFCIVLCCGGGGSVPDADGMAGGGASRPTGAGGSSGSGTIPGVGGAGGPMVISCTDGVSYTVTTFKVSAGNLVTSPDGYLWFTRGYDFGRITPDGGVTLLQLPNENDTSIDAQTTPGSPLSLTIGPDGNLWYTKYPPHMVGYIAPTGKATDFRTQNTTQIETRIAAGPDGSLWFTEANAIARITLAGDITDFPLARVLGERALAFAIVAGPDGNVWFSVSHARDMLATINPTTGTVTSVTTPDEVGDVESLVAGSAGDLWFVAAEYNDTGSVFGRITPPATFSVFPIPYFLRNIALGPDGNLWFTGFSHETIGRVSPDGVITECSRVLLPGVIVTGPDRNIWFTYENGQRIGRITP